MKKKYYGLTGRMASGKGVVADMLKERGYRYISLSDIVREEIAKAGKTLSRDQMQDFGNNLRKTGGAGVLGRRVREKIEQSDDDCWVIDGIRNPAEVEELKQLANFYLLGIESSRAIILERIKSRQRAADNADDAELERRLDREWGIGEPEDGQQVGKCMAMADHLIDNNSTLEALQKNILEVINLDQ